VTAMASATEQPRAAVIVPIYNAAAVLRDCLESLRRTLTADDQLILIDDASSDPEIGALLATFADQAPCPLRLERNARNLGFVRTVNLGMALTRADVVLLNSDTVVTKGWLQRLQQAAQSSARIATVTPFSNHAEICSFPLFCQQNPLPVDPEQTAAQLAALTPQYPELPTAVGFCMLIRRAALVELGDFDAATFGRGYGEENDFCRRALGHGWRNVLCDNAYVVHRGGVSFAATGEKPGGEALRRLSARYPGYNAAVAEFIRCDPLAEIRRQAQR